MQKYSDVVFITGVPGGQVRAPATASVQVNITNGGAATLYSDNGVTTRTNPITTDSSGEYSFYAANGTYDLVISVTGFTTETKTAAVQLFDAAASSGASGIGFLPSGTGAIAESVQSALRRIGVYPEQFGAVGDGTTDDFAALQLAINAATAAGKPILLTAGKNYKFGTALDCTNHATGGIRFIGLNWGESASLGAVLTANTGGVAIDATGTQYFGMESLSLVSGGATPSTLGVLLARSTTSQYAQFPSFKNVRISMATNATAFTNRGSVGIYNNASELCDYYNVYIIADNPLVCVGANDFGVASVYRTIDTGITSESRIRISGGNNTLTCLKSTRFALFAKDVLDIECDAYMLGTGTGVGVYLKSCTRAKIRSHLELFSSAMTLGNGNQMLDVEVDMVLGTAAPFLTDSLEFVRVKYSKLTCFNSFGGAHTAPYILDGAGTDDLQYVFLNAPNWTPGTGSTDINNKTSLQTFINGTSVLPADSIKFNNSVVTDTTSLDYYKEGTFTPSLTFGGGSTGMTYSFRAGYYTRIGNRVFYSIVFLLTAKGSSTGAAKVDGLPFTSTGVGEITTGSVEASKLTFTGQVSTRVPGTGTTVDLYSWATTGALTALTDTAFAADTQLNLSGFYAA